MKSFADWTDEIKALNNPAPTALEVGTAIHTEVARVGSVDITAWLEKEKAAGRDPFNAISFEPYPIIEFKPENTVHWGVDTGRIGGDKTVVAHRIQGKAADVVLIDEVSRVDPEKLENLRKQYLGDWGPYDKDEAEKAVGSLHAHNSRGPARHHDYRVGQSVGQLMACLHPDHSLVVEKLRGRSARHPRTSIRVMDGRGTFVHEVIVE